MPRRSLQSGALRIALDRHADRALIHHERYLGWARPPRTPAASTMELEIRNAQLNASAVPDSPDDPEALETFALSFDGYAHWGDRCGSLAQAAAEAFHADRSLPHDLSDLRACLFYEHQRRRWQPAAADDAARAYMQALLDAIRAAVAPRD